MSESIQQRVNALPIGSQKELKPVLDSILTDLASLRAAFVALTAKMDADFADVTNASTDYASSVDPDALNTVT